MTEPTNLDDHRPHQVDYVACLSCGHDWVAVKPVTARPQQPLECPSCGKGAGEPVQYDDEGWFSRFMSVATEPDDIKRRSMVLINAKRMRDDR